METLRTLTQYFKEKGVETPRPSDELFAHIEEVLLPHLLRVLQRDNAVLAEVELFPGIKVPWEGTDAEWKMLHVTLLRAVLSGNAQEKFGKIFETVKGIIPGLGGSTDDITKILEDEENQSSFQELLELVMNTRLASIMGDIVQAVQYDDLDLNLEDTEQLLEMLKNPRESPVLNELMTRAQAILEDRIKTGKINQQELVREIETIRAKFQSSFGKYLNELIVGDAGGGTTGNTSNQILSNSPEARRARMLARLQKKQRENKLRK